MKEEEVMERAKEIHELHKNGNEKEARLKFKELVQESMAWCNICRKYVPIELDKSTSNKPFYFCIFCGNPVKKLEIKEGRIIDLQFHKK